MSTTGNFILPIFRYNEVKSFFSCKDPQFYYEDYNIEEEDNIDESHEPDHVGSGFFFETMNSLFLVTAGHVYKNFKEHPLGCWLNDGFYEIGGNWGYTPDLEEGNEDSDIFDIAVLVVDDNLHELIKKSCLVVNDSIIERRHRQSWRNIYKIIGFPIALATTSSLEKKIKVKGFSYKDYGAKNDTYKELKQMDSFFNRKEFHQRSHVLVNASSKCNRLNTKGLSGGGIWSSDKLVALTIEHIKEKNLFVDVSISHVLDAIKVSISSK